MSECACATRAVKSFDSVHAASSAAAHRPACCSALCVRLRPAPRVTPPAAPRGVARAAARPRLA
jgi:hypothetical protein